MTQPKALFLADVLHNDPASKSHHDEAAFELRRLHAQRGALLEALKKIAADHAYFSGDTLSYARAAIAKAEEQT